MSTYCVLLLASELPRRLEVNTQERELALVILADVLDGVNVEGHGKTVHGKDNGLRLPIDEDLIWR